MEELNLFKTTNQFFLFNIISFELNTFFRSRNQLIVYYQQNISSPRSQNEPKLPTQLLHCLKTFYSVGLLSNLEFNNNHWGPGCKMGGQVIQSRIGQSSHRNFAHMHWCVVLHKQHTTWQFSLPFFLDSILLLLQ